MFTQVSQALLNVAAFQKGMCSLESTVSYSNLARKLIAINPGVTYFLSSAVSNERFLVCDLNGKNSVSLSASYGEWIIAEHDSQVNLEIHNVKEIEKLYAMEIKSIVQDLNDIDFDLNAVQLPNLESIYSITITTGFNESGISILQQMQRVNARIGFILNRNQPVSVGSSINTQKIFADVLTLNNRFQVLMTNALIFELTSRVEVIR